MRGDPGQYGFIALSRKNRLFELCGIQTGKLEESSVQGEKAFAGIGQSKQVGPIFGRKETSSSQTNLVDQTWKDGITSQSLPGRSQFLENFLVSGIVTG